jgi:hypothetical protein
VVGQQRCWRAGVGRGCGADQGGNAHAATTAWGDDELEVAVAGVSRKLDPNHSAVYSSTGAAPA